MADRNVNRWLYSVTPNPTARLCLFCFPYAGGSAHIYQDWGSYLGPDVALYAIQLPGRGTRIAEKPLDRIDELLPPLAEAVLTHQNCPYAFFGHSLGALLAYALTQYLQQQAQEVPVHLFLSGRRAPHLPPRRPAIHGLPDAAFIDELRRYKGTPDTVLHDQELMELFLPALRADFALSETYCHASDEPLRMALSVFGGNQDEIVDQDELAAWEQYAAGTFSIRMFPGDHFFLQSAQPLLLRVIAQELSA